MDYEIDDEFHDLSQALRQLLRTEAPVQGVLDNQTGIHVARQQEAIRALNDDGWMGLLDRSRQAIPNQFVGSLSVATEFGRTPTVGLAPFIVGFITPLLEELEMDDAVLSPTSAPLTTIVPRSNPELCIFENSDVPTNENRRFVMLLPDVAHRILVLHPAGADRVEFNVLHQGDITSEVRLLDGPDLSYRLGEMTIRPQRNPGQMGIVLPRTKALAALRRAQGIYRLMLSAQAVGGSSEMVERTVVHLSDRQQFGRPLSAFQALRHRVADMFMLQENSRALLYEAAWRFSEKKPDAMHWVNSARIYSARAYRTVCEGAIQCHGGMGFTWASGLHVWYRNALADSLLLTDIDGCRQAILEEAILPISEPRS